MSRHRHHSSSRAFLLFNPNTTLGWSVARRIGVDRGEAMVDAGTAIRVNDGMGKHIGYQLRPDNEPRRFAASVQSSICITKSELEAAVGLMGKSATRGLSEEDRLSRVHPLTKKALPAEDFIERAEVKVASYSSVFDLKSSPYRRAVCVAG